MLKRIICDKFVQKEIVFGYGLNAVVGDDIASNSIGKSTMLMIIDFVFGGEDYIKKNHDAVENLGHHEFKFSFEFGEEKLYFIRSTGEYKYIYSCNEKFEVKNTIKVQEFTEILQKKYCCQVEDLSFRNIVGRYFRVYGKENLNERKPIQYVEKESSSNSILALLKLFDKFRVIKDYEAQIGKLSSERTVLLEAAKNDLIPHVTKTIFSKNEKKIEELKKQLELLKVDIVSASADIEALVSKEVLSLQKEKSLLSLERDALENRLIRTKTNLANKNINIQPELKRLTNYFPNFNIEEAKKVDFFHATITSILKEELKHAEKEIKVQLDRVEKQIVSLNEKMKLHLTVQNAPKFAIEKVIDLSAQIKQLTDENGYYAKKKNLDENIKTQR